MGFLEYLKKKSAKRDYAQEFKDAFENHEIDKIFKILDAWLKNDSDDANLTLAMVIIGSLGQDEFNSLFENYLSSAKEKPTNPSLYDWFNSTAINLMEKRADEDMEFNEMFNNRYKSNKPSNDYAIEFLTLIDDILENNDAEGLNEMQELVEKWERDCPDDANMHCAYVILNAFKLSDDELRNRIEKAEDFIPIDKNSYAKFLALMHGVCERKNGGW